VYALLRELIARSGQHRRARRHGDRHTAANRRFTFRRPRPGAADRLRTRPGGVAFLIGLALTNGALLVLHSVSRSPRHTVEIAVLIVANSWPPRHGSSDEGLGVQDRMTTIDNVVSAKKRPDQPHPDRPTSEP